MWGGKLLQVKCFNACQEEEKEEEEMEEEADQENKAVFVEALFCGGLSQEKIHKTIINS
jgi:hypothetical protein